MTRAGRLICVTASVFATLVQAQEVDVAASAFVELDTERSVVFERQLFRLTLRFGVDREFLRENVVQPFRQELDVPVRVDVPWLDDPAGVAVVDRVTPGDDARGASFVFQGRLDRALRVADREIEGRVFAVHRIDATVVVSRTGEIRIPGPRLHLAYATRFREDFLDGRVPEDQRDATVAGADLVLDVEPLPAVGRPAGFTGAVGRFSARADVDRRELVVGESFELVLRIDGDGNLATFDTPKLGRVGGFHVRGTIEERSRSSRTLVHDLVPLRDDLVEIPALEFSYFDPSPSAGYRTTRTDPIPVTVRAAPPGVRVELPPESADRVPVPGEDDIFGPKDASLHRDAPPARRLSRGFTAVVLAVPWVIALVLLTWRRAHARRERDRDRARMRGVHEAFVARADRGDVADAFVDYLATRLCRTPAAVVTPDLERCLVDAGVPAAPAQRAATMLDGFVAARFGADDSAETAGSARALVDELETAFRAAEIDR